MTNDTIQMHIDSIGSCRLDFGCSLEDHCYD
jgi:hypothetical protein